MITDDQVAGKGQAGNAWVTEKGKNLTFSLILKPKFLAARDQFNLTIAVSLALKNVLEDVLPGEVMIKWPNDIYFKERKIAGMLIENVLRGQKLESSVVGIGLNVNQVDFPLAFHATSMLIESNMVQDINGILNDLLVEISKHYFALKEASSREQMKKAYHAALLGMEEERNFKANGTNFVGKIIGTDDFGRLLIEFNGGIHVFAFKQVEMLF